MIGDAVAREAAKVAKIIKTGCFKRISSGVFTRARKSNTGLTLFDSRSAYEKYYESYSPELFGQPVIILQSATNHLFAG